MWRLYAVCCWLVKIVDIAYRLYTIATIILNQQQTACNVHNLAQPTTYNIQCPQTSPSNCRLHSMSTIILKQLHTTYNVHNNRLQPTTDCIQCLQSVITNYRWHTMSKPPDFLGVQTVCNANKPNPQTTVTVPKFPQPFPQL